MTRRRKSVILAKLAGDSDAELKSMVAEISGLKTAPGHNTAKSSGWARRFAASGKNFAPKIRES